MSKVSYAPGYVSPAKASHLLKKWEPVLNCEDEGLSPITNKHQRLATAMILENQENYCLENSNSSGAGGVFGTAGTSLYDPSYAVGATSGNDRYATGDTRMPKVLIPMVRRTFPELITNELVGVQPMAGPVGMAFAMRYRYEPTSLGANGLDGYANGSTTLGTNWQRSGLANKELGYQELDTRFTGASSSQIVGNADFTMIDQDQGVAAILSQFELTGNIPQVTIDFAKIAIEAGTRRIAARWSTELEQDLKNMNGLDIDSELTNALSYEIQAEIDREVVVRMIQISLNGGKGTGYSFWYAASADARWLGERNRDFYAKIIVEANRIAIRNRRGSANFILATPKVCAILEMLPEFAWMPVNGSINTQPTGLAKVGTVGGRFTLYRDTRTEAQNLGTRASGSGTGYAGTAIEYALLGYKGNEYYDTGIVFCPYIPVMIQRTVGANDFTPRVGLMTRYGICDYIFGASLYYHMIIVKGLGVDNVNSSGKIYM